jgi:hypothetical protein
MKIIKWLKDWQYNRLLGRLVRDLNKLRMEDLMQIPDYADSLYSARKRRQEKEANK